MTVSCSVVRESISATFDGELAPLDEATVGGHVDGCAACQRWEADLALVSRQLRLQPVLAPVAAPIAVPDAVPSADTADPVEPERTDQRPELADLITDQLAAQQLRGRQRLARQRLSRVLLAIVGVLQLALSIAQLLGAATMTHPMAGAGEHLSNESAAWNLALGAGFVVAAGLPRLARGLLPTLAAFLAVLTVVSAVDLWQGNASAGRVSSHVLVLLGALLLLWVHLEHRDADRSRRARPGSTEQTDSAAWDLADTEAGAVPRRTAA
nr:zf-HC2 domain-containing protein [Nakamurella aerolata]